MKPADGGLCRTFCCMHFARRPHHQLIIESIPGPSKCGHMHAFADCGFARGVISCRPHSRSSFFFPKRAVPLNQTFESPPRAPMTPNPQEPPRSHTYISPPHSPPSQRVIRFLNSNRRTSRHILKPISPAIHNRLAVYHPPLPTTYLQQNHLAFPLQNGSQLVSSLRKAHFPRRILLRALPSSRRCPLPPHAGCLACRPGIAPAAFPCAHSAPVAVPFDKYPDVVPEPTSHAHHIALSFAQVILHLGVKYPYAKSASVPMHGPKSRKQHLRLHIARDPSPHARICRHSHGAPLVPEPLGIQVHGLQSGSAIVHIRLAVQEPGRIHGPVVAALIIPTGLATQVASLPSLGLVCSRLRLVSTVKKTQPMGARKTWFPTLRPNTFNPPFALLLIDVCGWFTGQARALLEVSLVNAVVGRWCHVRSRTWIPFSYSLVSSLVYFHPLVFPFLVRWPRPRAFSFPSILIRLSLDSTPAHPHSFVNTRCIYPAHPAPCFFSRCALNCCFPFSRVSAGHHARAAASFPCFWCLESSPHFHLVFT